MDYRFNDFDFSTNLEFYKVIPTDSDEYSVTERLGQCVIYAPKKICPYGRPAARLQNIKFTYAGIEYRIRSVDPITMTILEIKDLDEDVIEITNHSIKILSNHLTRELIEGVFEQAGLVDRVTPRWVASIEVIPDFVWLNAENTGDFRVVSNTDWEIS